MNLQTEQNMTTYDNSTKNLPRRETEQCRPISLFSTIVIVSYLYILFTILSSHVILLSATAIIGIEQIQ
ncbi:hypothetical protein LINPERPRIM_LOCUS15741, partial [Linum perenne]